MSVSVRDAVGSIVFLLLIFFLVNYIFFSPKHGLTQEIAEKGKDTLLNALPGGLGQEKPQQGQTPIPQKAADSQNELFSKMSSFAKTESSNCLIPLASLSGLEGFEMEVTNSKGQANGATITLLKDEKYGESRNDQKFIDGVEICSLNPSAFHQCSLTGTGTSCTQGISSTPSLQKISPSAVQPYLFKTSKNKVCTIPKSDPFFRLPGCREDEKGIRSACLDDLRNKFPLCT